ncbi:MAG: sporulation protein YunB [Bacillota bacterium]
MRWRRYRVRRSRVLGWRGTVFAILLVLVMTAVLFEVSIRPTVLAIGQAQLHTAAVQLINEMIGEEIVKGCDWHDLFSMKVENGRVIALQPNTITINLMTSRAQDAVSLAMERLGILDIRIPLGQALGSQLLANVGPTIRLRAVPMGWAEVDLIERFEDAGVNQVRHVIEMQSVVKLRMVMPLFRSEVSVRQTTPLATMVIVGEVPQTYVRIGR